MSNYKYYKAAKNGLDVYIAQFPQDTGNLKYNATKINGFRLTKSGAEWAYNTSGSKATYAEPLNDGYEQQVYGRKTGRFVQGKFFYEKGAIVVSRYLQNLFQYGMLAGKAQLSSAKMANNTRNLDSDARKFVMNKSLTMVSNGTIKLGKPTKFDLELGEKYELR